MEEPSDPPSDSKTDPLDDVVISLEKIVQAFGIGINEEQAWAILHETSCYLKESIGLGGSELMWEVLGRPELNKVLFRRDGTVTVARQDGSPVEDDCSEEGFLEILANTVFEACNFGVGDDSEVALSDELEDLIARMGEKRLSQAHGVTDLQHNGDASDSNERVCHSEENGMDLCDRALMDAVEVVIQECCGHFGDAISEARNHYRAVCRALVVECSDLQDFLKRFKPKNLSVVGTKKGKTGDVERMETSAEDFRNWAKLWMQVVGKLRETVSLRKVSSLASAPAVYELTPYEILMEDIRLQRFSLRNTPAPEASPRKMDAHDIILDYIRSRPPLVPAENRQLRPRMEHQSPIEVLMESIRRFHFNSLRKTDRQKEKSGAADSIRRERSVIQPGASFEMAESSGTISSSSSSTLPKRRLVLPDTESATPVDFLSAAEEDEQNFGEEADDMNDGDFYNENDAKVENDVNPRNGTRGRHSEVVSLSLDEIALIRGALAKAELDNLEEQDMALYKAIRSSKVCYSCKNVKFGFSWWFRETGIKCHLCQNTICMSCSREMILPCNRLDRIPVHTLSPTIAPEEEPWPEMRFCPQPLSQNLLNKRPLSTHAGQGYSSTMPRSRLTRPGLQRSQTQDLTSMTLPKPQTRSRPALQRGLTIDTAGKLDKKPSLLQIDQAIIVQVCLECHSVLYHAIVESQSQLAAIYPSNGGKRLRPQSALNSQRPFGNGRMPSSLTAIDLSSRHHRTTPLRSSSHFSLTTPSLSRHASSIQASNGNLTSSSSVVSDSHSDSLEDDDLNGEELEDFLEEMPAPFDNHDDVTLGVSPALSMSRSNSNASASNSDGDSTSRPAVFFSNHI